MAWQTAPRDATLIVDGIFLNRPELRALWNYSIWLDGPEEPATPRAAGAHALYQAEADPRARASAIVDNSDPEHPLRTFADSC
jgi:uridine kinase